MIDTAAKRRSVAGIGRKFRPAQTPDNAKPQAWRQVAGSGYAGILAADGVLYVPSAERTATGAASVREVSGASLTSRATVLGTVDGRTVSGRVTSRTVTPSGSS